MAKGLGLIGNFRGKFGNAVGYNLKDSNNKQTQGIRIYQPIVKNPKTYAQAEQRAKLAPINATYRLLKPIIDRGQEGFAYGNKSRLAWLKTAMKEFNGGWFDKGAQIIGPAIVGISKGSLAVNITYNVTEDSLRIPFTGTVETAPTTIGQLSTVLLAQYPTLSVGDQVSVVCIFKNVDGYNAFVTSFVIDPESDITLTEIGLAATTTMLVKQAPDQVAAATVIVSREGDNGQHLRTSSTLTYSEDSFGSYMSDTAKESAIRSYMAAGTSTDWPEEPIEG